MTPNRFTGWQVVALVACCVSPFWFLASDPTDGSELKATAWGAAIGAVVLAVLKGLNHRR